MDVAIAWLPLPDTEHLSHKVIAVEQRWVALPANHRLARRRAIPFGELAGERTIALPSSAGGLREFWLANDQRTAPAQVVAEVATADETFEAVASGVGVVLVSAGNAEIYRREGFICLPVRGLSPSELAVVWRTGDHRPAVHSFIDACLAAVS